MKVLFEAVRVRGLAALAHTEKYPYTMRWPLVSCLCPGALSGLQLSAISDSLPFDILQLIEASQHSRALTPASSRKGMHSANASCRNGCNWSVWIKHRAARLCALRVRGLMSYPMILVALGWQKLLYFIVPSLS